jgi:hypothetical protein
MQRASLAVSVSSSRNEISIRSRPVSASRICYLSVRLRACCRQSRSAVTSTCSNQRQGSRCHLQQRNPLQTRVDGQTERQQRSALQDTAAIAENAMAVDRWWREDLFLGAMGRHGRWAWRFGARRHDWRCRAGTRERRSRSHAPMFVSGRMGMPAPDQNVFFAVAVQFGPHADPPAREPFAPSEGD